jgi:ABC-2 type transport system permease protein
MNLIGSSFMATSFALYLARFTRNIEEILVAPFSYNEMIFSYTATGVIRGFIVGVGVFAMAMFFGAANMAHVGLFMFYSLSVAVVFAFMGILVALWAKNFEQLSVLSTFVITPLSFLGGVFNSIHMMPQGLQWFVRVNPFFYFVDGLRYSMIGYSESNRTIGIFVILSLMIGLGMFTWSLFKKGYKIRA